MEEIKLFKDYNQNWLTNIDLLNALKQIKADECDVLYIHSSLSFGMPNSELKRVDILKGIFDVLRSLNVKTICMPTFTFSFCNGLIYDPVQSKTKMGVLNDYFRKQDGVIRSRDPFLSVALLGADTDLVLGIGHSSCGANSTFDKIRHSERVKFLFLGPKIGDCLTYMHYLEWLYSVDYRYERVFNGDICIDGNTAREEYSLFVRYNGVSPNVASYVYEQRMYDKKMAQKINFGNGSISIVDKDNATVEYKKCLDENPYFFVNIEGEKLNKDKTFRLQSEMVAM